MYGCNGADGSFASNCLLARRLAERGVRFIQLYHRDWDLHDGIRLHMPRAGRVGRPAERRADHATSSSAACSTTRSSSGAASSAARRWPRATSRSRTGRDHHIHGFSMWLAGGGIKPGTSYGATDELGYNAVENIVHVHDLHATMLHLLGIDHERLTYRYQGRDFRLTDVAGKVVKGILA